MKRWRTAASAFPRPAGGRCSIARWLLLACALLTIALPESVEGRANPSQTLRHLLANGLTLLVEERPTSRSANLTIMIGAGSRDDAETPGLLYFLSRTHLLGTPRRPSERAVQQAITATGGTLDRGTARDTTQFVVNVPAGDVDAALDLLADILQNSLLAEDALEREKRVVAQEIDRRLGNPSEVASDLLYGTLYEGHALGRPIVGNLESIAALDRAELVEARDRYYVASNLVLAVAGRVNSGDILTRAQQHFGGMAQGQRNSPEAAPADVAGIKSVEARAGRQQAIVQLAVRGPAAGHPDRYPFMVLDDVLGLVSGRIFTEVRVKRGLAYVAGSGYGVFRDTGAWTAYAGADPENIDEVAALLLDEMRRAREEPLTPEELQDAISHATGRQLVGGESNAAKAQTLARRETLGLPDTDESVVEAFRRVTVEDVQRVAQTYLDPDRYVLVVVRP